VTTDDIIEPAMEAEAIFRATCLSPQTLVTLDRLAGLEPTTLALMHGSSFSGDGAKAITELADAYDERYLSAGVAAVAGA
jgi:hypothetical protein